VLEVSKGEKQVVKFHTFDSISDEAKSAIIQEGGHFVKNPYEWDVTFPEGTKEEFHEVSIPGPGMVNPSWSVPTRWVLPSGNCLNWSGVFTARRQLEIVR
jgi:hypothetical protein